MNKIEVKVLNPQAVHEAEQMMVAMARMTQRGHDITNMADLEQLLNKDYRDETLSAMAALPHPTIQKFGLINIAIVGASRRFLAQITRHQNEVKFMSGSLQYSDYSGTARFCVPYEITTMDCEHVGNAALEEGYYTRNYLSTCEQALAEYEAAINCGLPHDAAGYMMPQGMRNVLIISATPYQWKHMISQRICSRNTKETQYVMLRCWEELYPLSAMFRVGAGPSCMTSWCCNEGKMSCGHYLYDVLTDDYADRAGVTIPTAILDMQFKHIRGEKV